VLIGGCHPGDCHYQEGNYKALRRFKLLQKMLDQFGIERDRVRLEWIAASEGDKVQKVTNEMTERLRELGPIRLRSMQRLAPPGPVAGPGGEPIPLRTAAPKPAEEVVS
jgi:F420-non-reducing hydrogenase iron-sulfur subunit